MPSKSQRGTKPGRPDLVPRRVVPGQGGSLVQQAVDSLRDAVLGGAPPGTFLGSEEDLIAALGVSRPTFRQAAKLLKAENLLLIRRGMGGGFFTQAPSTEAVTRMVSIYLNAQGTTIRQINQVVAPLQAEAAREIALNPDLAVRSRLTEFLERHRSGQVSVEERHPIRRMIAFEHLLVEIAGNPANALMMRVMLTLIRDGQLMAGFPVARSAELHERFQEQLARAILDGDAEMAVLLCRRHASDFNRTLTDSPVRLEH
jgi:DNA-binding FadR family transcriptional regulator